MADPYKRTKPIRFSPSKLEALELCPCFEYKTYEEKPGEDGEETVAQRGTRLHLAVETEDLELCNDEYETSLVQSCIEYNKSMVPPDETREHQILKEFKVQIPERTRGVLDRVVLWGPAAAPTSASLRDFKFIKGFSVSAPEDNLQLAAYAGGLMYTFPTLESVDVGLVAPEIRYAPEPAVLTRADLPRIEARIDKVIAEANDPFKKPRLCDNCSLCEHAGRCPAMNAAVAVAGQRLGLPMPSSFAVDGPATEQDRLLAHILKGAFENWNTKVSQNNLQYVLSGNSIPGLKLVERGGSTEITDAQSAIDLLQAGGIPWNTIIPAVKLSAKTLIENVAKMHTGKGAKLKAASQIAELLGPVMRKRPDIRFLQRERSVNLDRMLESGTVETQEEPTNT